ncbi:hypothetical protein CEXT_781201 [Caerostris extrusa]|uniref:Uncharacterized protein n=1 Tax=Caerostris extrusa TaxID=172846 RepID=A0AAV4XKS0_CAEEX|nr:hypothetical protein CEXT_781201 [Caerostris extrusa]
MFLEDEEKLGMNLDVTGCFGMFYAGPSLQLLPLPSVRVLFGAVTSLAPNIGCFVILRFLLGLTVPASVATPAALENTSSLVGQLASLGEPVKDHEGPVTQNAKVLVTPPLAPLLPPPTSTISNLNFIHFQVFLSIHHQVMSSSYIHTS